MKKLTLTLSIIAMTTMLMAQKVPVNPAGTGNSNPGTPINTAPLAACDNEKGYYDYPFTQNGITVTGSGSGSYTVFDPSWYACAITNKPGSVWIGLSGPATFVNTFSEPVNDMIYNLTGANPGEGITITTDGGTPTITYTDGTCPEAYSISGNTITCIVMADPYQGSGGRILIHAPADFNTITFSHDGNGAAGTVVTMCFDQAVGPPSGVPVSNWALILGGLMIATFVFIRYRRMI